MGNSVVRHRVARRLRHLVADRLGTLTPGSTLVVRALPPAARASSADLAHDFDAAVRRLKLAVEQ
nr:Ribonuclease P protein component [Kibdelosporangium sp. MJ126-NF4]CTQ93934.1 Ribonuclease P protein component (EC 3.1.26.5) [Kibdelosporangium sp. MJ126-NF4]